LSRDFYLLI